MDIIPWRRRAVSRPIRRDLEDFMGLRPFEREMEDFMTNMWGEWSPAVDVAETDGKVRVKAELPGLEAKDIDVDVDGDVLTIRGEKKKEEEKKDEKYYCRETYSGSFQRSFRLPTGVKSDQVDAKFKNGVLTIDIPKSEESKQRKIDIKAE